MRRVSRNVVIARPRLYAAVRRVQAFVANSGLGFDR
jgi:hypothetical protein